MGGRLRRSNRNVWSGFRRERNEDAWQLHLLMRGGPLSLLRPIAQRAIDPHQAALAACGGRHRFASSRRKFGSIRSQTAHGQTALRFRRAVGPSCGLDAAALARPFLRFTFILSLRNGICGTAGLSVPCPRTSTTLAKQQRRCSKWRRPPPIPLLLRGLLKLLQLSRTKLASYPRKRLSKLQTCSPRKNHLRRVDHHR